MMYIIRKPPSKEDTTMQLWSPKGQWIADIREKAWPGSAETILSAMNGMIRLRELCASGIEIPDEIRAIVEGTT